MSQLVCAWCNRFLEPGETEIRGGQLDVSRGICIGCYNAVADEEPVPGWELWTDLGGEG